MVYTEFVSMLTQAVQVKRLMPLEIEEAEGGEGGPVPSAYEFEPSAQAALDLLLPNYVETASSTCCCSRRRRSRRRSGGP